MHQVNGTVAGGIRYHGLIFKLIWRSNSFHTRQATIICLLLDKGTSRARIYNRVLLPCQSLELLKMMINWLLGICWVFVLFCKRGCIDVTSPMWLKSLAKLNTLRVFWIRLHTDHFPLHKGFGHNKLEVFPMLVVKP